MYTRPRPCTPAKCEGSGANPERQKPRESSKSRLATRPNATSNEDPGPVEGLRDSVPMLSMSRRILERTRRKEEVRAPGDQLVDGPFAPFEVDRKGDLKCAQLLVFEVVARLPDVDSIRTAAKGRVEGFEKQGEIEVTLRVQLVVVADEHLLRKFLAEECQGKGHNAIPLVDEREQRAVRQLPGDLAEEFGGQFLEAHGGPIENAAIELVDLVGQQAVDALAPEQIDDLQARGQELFPRVADRAPPRRFHPRQVVFKTAISNRHAVHGKAVGP